MFAKPSLLASSPVFREVNTNLGSVINGYGVRNPFGYLPANAVGYDGVPFEGSSSASAVFSLSPGRERVVGVVTALVVSDWIIRNTPARVSDWLRQESQERHLLSLGGVRGFLLNEG
ncbi:hypothetical protein NPIL_250331 [Nephila pilipes]|uniref:Uncharacterized protein n=1 Tax=Nephila pilipes TaxID=299642 RepID=A0A8X6QBW6_NEPPI|nr:hypothetical protein NPIL_250331 [Nephila pilipes]